jgi:hypothetical protein
MPITILDYVIAQIGAKDTYTAADFASSGVEMLGGCLCCHATLGPYNAYPSKIGYWHCANCIGDQGFATVEEFVVYETGIVDSAVGLLQRLREFSADETGSDTAPAQASAEYESLTGSGLVNCPACSGAANIREISDGTFECRDCEAVWTP